MGSNIGDFRYEALGPNAIRLLRLQHSSPRISFDMIHTGLYETSDGTIDSIEASNNPKYIALSYVWGNPTKCRQIELNGKISYVAENLWQALKAIRDHHHDGQNLYWIDALCIDQDNTQEKSIQVSRMWLVYSTAKYVMSWLGTPDESSNIAFKALHTYATGCNYKQQYSEQVKCSLTTGQHANISDLEIAAIQFLLAHDYFERAWIYQEFSQAKYIQFLCGEHSIEWMHLWHFVCTNSRLLVPQDRINLFKARNQTRKMMTFSELFENSYEFVMQTLETFSHGQCSDVRDRIFAMCGDFTLRHLDQARAFLMVDYLSTPYELSIMVIAYFDNVVYVQGLRRPTENEVLGTLDELLLKLSRTFEMLITAEDLGLFVLWYKSRKGDLHQRRLPLRYELNYQGHLIASLLKIGINARPEVQFLKSTSSQLNDVGDRHTTKMLARRAAQRIPLIRKLIKEID